eukprot:6281-Chlamydomonas_euryale.AAC.9
MSANAIMEPLGSRSKSASMMRWYAISWRPSSDAIDPQILASVSSPYSSAWRAVLPCEICGGESAGGKGGGVVSAATWRVMLQCEICGGECGREEGRSAVRGASGARVWVEWREFLQGAVLGAWRMVHGAWCLAHGAQCMVLGWGGGAGSCLKGARMRSMAASQTAAADAKEQH